MRNSKLSAALREIIPTLRETTGPRMFFLTRMARNFRNCHPAHLDSTEHRVAMGGCHGTCCRFLPFSIPPQAIGPLIPSPPLHQRCAAPNPLRLCLPTPHLPHRRCATPKSLWLCVPKKDLCATYTLIGMPNTILSMPSVSTEFSYPEGVERLIGQGWREATTLSNRRTGCIRTL